MDRLTVMKSFVAVVRAESFSGAARTLGVSASLVSRHIADLEQQLGVRLINRTARAVSVTEQGQRYFHFSERLLAQVDQEDAELRGMQNRPEGPLGIIAPKWIGSIDLSDAVAAFAVEHPLITVRFDIGGMSDPSYDFVEKGYNLAFHTRYLRDSSMKARRVATLPFVLCAAPSYLRRHPAIVEPLDLAQHPCLIHGDFRVWPFERAGRQQHYKVQRIAFQSNTYLILHKAALAGLGVALLPLRPIFDDLRAGRLEAVLPDFPIPDRPLYIVYPPGLQSVKKLRVFLDFIAEWFKRFPIDEHLRPEAITAVDARNAT
jgi:DNA-binding transcriptional LysR family regulator